MREIEYSRQFKRDYRREKRGRYGFSLDAELSKVIKLLVLDEKLPPKMRDHSLKGNWQDFRDCHIKPDLVLIYRKLEGNALELTRLGTHSKLNL